MYLQSEMKGAGVDGQDSRCKMHDAFKGRTQSRIYYTPYTVSVEIGRIRVCHHPGYFMQYLEYYSTVLL